MEKIFPLRGMWNIILYIHLKRSIATKNQTLFEMMIGWGLYALLIAVFITVAIAKLKTRGCIVVDGSTLVNHGILPPSTGALAPQTWGVVESVAGWSEDLE